MEVLILRISDDFGNQPTISKTNRLQKFVSENNLSAADVLCMGTSGEMHNVGNLLKKILRKDNKQLGTIFATVLSAAEPPRDKGKFKEIMRRFLISHLGRNHKDKKILLVAHQNIFDMVTEVTKFNEITFSSLSL